MITGILKLFGALAILAGIGMAMFTMDTGGFGAETVALGFFASGLLTGALLLAAAQALEHLAAIRASLARPGEGEA